MGGRNLEDGKVAKMVGICRPNGPAAEYAPLALNLYNGCVHGCRYCYASAVARRKAEDYHSRVFPYKDVLANVKRDVKRLDGSENVLLCFMGDAYQPVDAVTRGAKGTGKGLLVYPLNAILGEHFVQVTGESDFLGASTAIPPAPLSYTRTEHSGRAEIAWIEIKWLKEHPKNPRIAIREDVINGIMAGIENGFHPSHALKVWPDGENFVIVAGHHRLEAAKRKGIDRLPCWVRDDLDEDGAFMLLATDNNQGELSPLEIGMHALNYVQSGHGGRGRKGGLSEYARQLGRPQPIISRNKAAAMVASKLISQDIGLLLDKAKHLAYIHQLPETIWQQAVEHILKKEWSAKLTQALVKAAKEGKTDKHVGALFLGKTSDRELARIADIRDNVLAKLSYKDLKEQWLKWFDKTDPIDIKVVQEKRVEFENAQYERLEAEQELEREELPGLVLADPPWKYDFSNTDTRQIENQYPSATVDEIIDHAPETQPDCILFLWATAPKLKEAIEVLEAWGFKYKTHSVWDKGKIGMGYWFRGQHELLLVGTKGEAKPPEPKNRVSSVFREIRTKHSKKPNCVYDWIEEAFPAIKKLEMYCREPRDRWLTFGNESDD